MQSAVLLIALVVAPVLGAIVLFALPRLEPRVATVVGAGVAIAELVGAIVLAVGYHPNGAVFQDASTQVVAAPFGLYWRAGVDGISLLLIVLTAIIVPIAVLGAPERHRTRASIAWLLLLESATVGKSSRASTCSCSSCSSS